MDLAREISEFYYRGKGITGFYQVEWRCHMKQRREGF
jgi:hypothetical protein